MNDGDENQETRYHQYTSAARTVTEQAKVLAVVVQGHQAPSKAMLIKSIAESAEGAYRLRELGYDPEQIAAACFSRIAEQRRDGFGTDELKRFEDKAAALAHKRSDPDHRTIGISDLCDSIIAEAASDPMMEDLLSGRMPLSTAERMICERLKEVTKEISAAGKSAEDKIIKIENNLAEVGAKTARTGLTNAAALILMIFLAAWSAGLTDDRNALVTWLKQLFA